MFPTGFPKKEASRQLCTNRKATRGEGWLKEVENTLKVDAGWVLSVWGEEETRRPRTLGRSKSGPESTDSLRFQFPTSCHRKPETLPRAPPSATPAKKEKNKINSHLGPRPRGPNKGRRSEAGSVPRPPARQRPPGARPAPAFPRGGQPPLRRPAGGGGGRGTRTRTLTEAARGALRVSASNKTLFLTPGTRGRRGSRCDPRGGAGEGAGGRASPGARSRPHLPPPPPPRPVAPRPSPPPHAAAARVVRGYTAGHARSGRSSPRPSSPLAPRRLSRAPRLRRGLSRPPEPLRVTSGGGKGAAGR